MSGAGFRQELGQLFGRVEGARLKAIAATVRAAKLVLPGEIRRSMAAGRTPEGRAFPPLKHPRPSGGNVPLSDTRQLANSVVARQTGPTTVEVGSNLPRAALHQYGGVVTPRRGKYLAVPLTRDARRAGGPRRFPRPLFVAGKALCERRGGRLVAQYALVPAVAVPARPFLGVSRAALAKVRQAADAAMGRFTRG